jgi:hypothetical protein
MYMDKSSFCFALGRAREVWHCKQVQDSLGQLPRLDLESQHELLGHVLKVRASLAVALEGIDAAILEVIGELNLPAPQGDHCGATPQAAFPAARQRRGYDIELNMISRKDTKTIPRRRGHEHRLNIPWYSLHLRSLASLRESVFQ